MSEHKLLAACLKDRNAWEVIKENVERETWSPEGTIIFDLCTEFYETDKNVSSCDVDILCTRATRNVQSNKVSDIVVQGITSLAAMDVSAVNIAKEAIEFKSHILGVKIAARLTSGNTDRSVIKGLMDEYVGLGGSDLAGEGSEEIFRSMLAADLSAGGFSKEGLIQLYPRVLNEAIDGGVRGGHHVLIFAPTEMGKTLFVINLCYGFLRQNLRVLYVGNEDPATDILMRMMTRLTGMNKYEIIANPGRADDILSGRNWSNFIFANFSPGTFNQIHKAIEEHLPEVLVLDQLRNIDVSSENRTQALEKAATEARNTAKRFNVPVISVTQAADSASGKKILYRGDVDGSNVGIPGQCDLMIGIGADHDMEDAGMRMLSFPKNKLSGRHTPIPIQIDPLLSRVVE